MHVVGTSRRCKPSPLSVPATRGIKCNRETTAHEWLHHLTHHCAAAVRIHEPQTDVLSMPHDPVTMIQKLSYIQKTFHHRRQAILAAQYMFYLYDLLPDKWQQKVRKCRQACLELQLAEVRAAKIMGQEDVCVCEQEAHASVGAHPPPPPPLTNPSNLANMICGQLKRYSGGLERPATIQRFHSSCCAGPVSCLI